MGMRRFALYIGDVPCPIHLAIQPALQWVSYPDPPRHAHSPAIFLMISMACARRSLRLSRTRIARPLQPCGKRLTAPSLLKPASVAAGSTSERPAQVDRVGRVSCKTSPSCRAGDVGRVALQSRRRGNRNGGARIRAAPRTPHVRIVFPMADSSAWRVRPPELGCGSQTLVDDL